MAFYSAIPKYEPAFRVGTGYVLIETPTLEVTTGVTENSSEKHDSPNQAGVKQLGQVV